MDNNVYCSVVEQLNDRTRMLYTEAVKLVESFMNTIKENNYDVEKCILPVVTNSKYNGIPNISWYNKLEQREIEYNEIMSKHIMNDTHPSWYVHLLEKTEKGFKYIREEIEFVMSVFKKVNYWQNMSELDLNSLTHST